MLGLPTSPEYDDNTFYTRCVGAVGAKRGREKGVNSEVFKEDKGMNLSDSKVDKKVGNKVDNKVGLISHVPAR